MDQKYLIVISCGFILFASWFSYDVPGSVNNKFADYVQDYSANTIIHLYIAYALPNIFFPLMVGHYLSTRAVQLARFFVCFMVFGNLVFLAGVLNKHMPIMLVGRFFSGLGGECFTVTANRKINSYFRGKELATAIAVFNVIGKLGTFTTYLVVPRLIKFGLEYAVLLSCCFALIALCFSFFVDKQVTGIQINKTEIMELEEKVGKISEENVGKTSEENVGKLSEEKVPNINIWQKETENQKKTCDFESINAIGQISSEQSFNDSDLKHCPWEVKTEESQESLTIKEVPKLNTPPVCTNTCRTESVINLKNKLYNAQSVEIESEVLILNPGIRFTEKLHFTFYIYILLVLLFTVVWAPFYNLAPMIFQSKYKINNETACAAICEVEFIILLVYFGIGYIADNFGYKLYIILFGLTMLLSAHTLLYLTQAPLFIVCTMLALAFAMVVCYWPCLPLMVHEKRVGVGFAAVTATINVAYVVSPFIVSFFTVKDPTFKYVEIYFILLTMCGICSLAGLMLLNSKYKIGLNEPEMQKVK